MISTDCHATGRPEDYEPYLEPTFRGLYRDTIESVRQSIPKALLDEEEGLFATQGRADFAGAAAAIGGLDGEWNSAVRTEALENDHVAAEVIFPNGSPFMGSNEVSMKLAGARAYNRWLADFCASLPGRRAGIAQLCVEDPASSADEVRWAASAGLRGVLLPPNPRGVPPYLDPCYEPIWQACEETALPLHFHGTPEWDGYGDYGLASAASMASETSWFSRRPLTFLIWAGVLERHPDLRVVFAEIGGGWVPSALASLDGIYRFQAFEHMKNALSLSPSEYWFRQCSVAASFLTADEVRLRHRIGLDNLMWGSDYPHIEGTWPRSLDSLKRTFAGVPPWEAKQILAENPAKLYGFDLKVLQEVADRIGPPVDELLASPRA